MLSHDYDSGRDSLHRSHQQLDAAMPLFFAGSTSSQMLLAQIGSQTRKAHFGMFRQKDKNICARLPRGRGGCQKVLVAAGGLVKVAGWGLGGCLGLVVWGLPQFCCGRKGEPKAELN